MPAGQTLVISLHGRWHSVTYGLDRLLSLFTLPEQSLGPNERGRESERESRAGPNSGNYKCGMICQLGSAVTTGRLYGCNSINDIRI